MNGHSTSPKSVRRRRGRSRGGSISSLASVDDIEPLPPAIPTMHDEASSSARVASSSSSTSASTSRHSLNDTEHAIPASARYVTVSAILSRAGVLYPTDSSSTDGQDIFAVPPPPSSSSSHPRNAERRRPSGGTSSGNALEALGTLLLHRDSKGRASSLSFQRWQPDGGEPPSSRRFLQRLQKAGKATLGLYIPQYSSTDDSRPTTPTIAERRASKRRQEVGSNGAADEVTFVTVRTRRNQPSFEVSRPSSPRISGSSSLDAHAHAHTRMRLSRSQSYGIGSTYGLHDPPEAPPTPLGMPGDWAGSRGGGNGSTSSGEEDMALLLPPPLLDDAGSDQRSFEGLLGVRRAKEAEEARRRLQRLAARNRPAHKVGMMTALSNFVKAAHAADQATKAAAAAKRQSSGTRPSVGPRRHTEPPQPLEKRRKRPVVAEEMEVPSHGSSSRLLSTSMDSSRSSIDASRTLETVPEDDAGLSKTPLSQAPPPVATSRRSSIALRDREMPSAPRLLPIQAAMPETPFSPLAKSSAAASVNVSPPADYISARARPGSASNPNPPPAPRLAATVLSLPPSPWTPHAHARSGSSSRDQYPLFSLALSSNSASSSRDVSEPGTPRLAPTHLSYQPSPYPSEPGSLVASPKALSALVTSPEVLSASTQEARQPLTPSSEPASAPAPASPLALEPTKPDVAAPSASSSPRSFLLWWLLGDLGLNVQHRLLSPTRTSSSAASLPLLTLGFLTFCLSHLVELAYEVAETAALTWWFLRWLALNLTGRTVLSRCVLEAYALIQAEWTLVAKEDHEERGERERKADPQPRGLAKIQVLRGFIELVCLHAVTREQWLREGAGLRLTEGWDRGVVPDGGAEETEDVGASESDSDEEESDLVVTRRERDILEFTRTPRIRPQDAQGSGSYFHLSSSRKPSSSSSSSSTRSLIRTLKWASRLAVGAYGLHVHIVDLPPTFTPSGERFNRQTFAHLSRLNDPEDVLHADIQHLGDGVAADDGTPPYQPTFYVARDHVRKTIVVAVRGTQSFSDIIADLDMRTERFPLAAHDEDEGEEDGEDEGQGELTCHAGVLRASQALLAPGSTLLSTLSSALSDHPAYSLTFTGHSLGAAIASCLAMLLGRFDAKTGRWVIAERQGPAGGDLPPGRGVRAISFAPPATFSSSLARRASKGGARPLVLSVVLGGDIIPRAGHGQARELRRVLGALARVRRRRGEGASVDGREEEEEEDAARVHVFRSWWRWSRTHSSQERKRIESQLWRLRCDVEADLYSAIKARAASGVPPSPWVGPHSSAPFHQLAERRQRLVDAATLRSEEALGGVLIPAGRCLYIDEGSGEGQGQGEKKQSPRIYDVASPLSFFSLPLFTTTMFASHLPSSYESVIEDL
ncbi:hypothetical protein BDZ90DRAFT_231239 [Jaminaea rosea]|uniref:sn-1-specific diacylglycerol lipase n=1 Tax=Jaminaea rosea TaxID=1569628 RepID=A0A316UYM3_9BASI|nr:hypothetical protein BDZ90DRAFT_231239 [Jaminaea rosea]PWN28245.1 hypothetical protein BDZ90DRAFT_231239 [Jaminaea rosea]